MKMDFDFTADLEYEQTDGPAMLLRLVEALKSSKEVEAKVAWWVCEAHRRGGIKVIRLKQGRPSKIPAAKLKEVLTLLLDLRAKGGTAADGAVEVGTRLGVSITKGRAQKLLELAQDLEREDNEQRDIATRDMAITEFRRRRQNGVVGAQALREVSDIADWPMSPDLPLLQLYQIQEEEASRQNARKELKD